MIIVLLLLLIIIITIIIMIVIIIIIIVMNESIHINVPTGARWSCGSRATAPYANASIGAAQVRAYDDRA